jgi:hypothetical protein
MVRVDLDSHLASVAKLLQCMASVTSELAIPSVSSIFERRLRERSPFVYVMG